MRTGLGLALGLVLAACGHDADGPAALIPADQMLAVNACTGDQAPLPPEERAIQQSQGRVRRDGHTLHVGATSLTDNFEEGGDYAQYRYVGRLAEAPVDLFHVTLYEGVSWTIVDERGTVTGLGGAPLVSPDRSVFVVLLNGEPHYGSGVRVYALDEAGPRMLLDADTMPPCGGRWESSDVFSFSSYAAALDLDPNPPLAPARLVRENGVWRYEGLRP